MSAQIVPLTASPQQSFNVTVQIDNTPVTLNIEINWSSMAGYWVMTISDSGGNLLLDSLPLITGWYPAANILAQYAYLAIGSAFIVSNGNTTSDYPGQPDLGTGWSLIWDDTPGLEQVA